MMSHIYPCTLYPDLCLRLWWTNERLGNAAYCIGDVEEVAVAMAMVVAHYVITLLYIKEGYKLSY
jgi:hypothetical protein